MKWIEWSSFLVSDEADRDKTNILVAYRKENAQKQTVIRWFDCVIPTKLSDIRIAQKPTDVSMILLFCEEMNSRKERRWCKLRIALFAMPLLIIGSMALAPVQVLRPVLDSEGQQVYREDGRRMMETDHWGNFKVNWIGFSLIYAGIGVTIWGVGGWLYEGLVRGQEIKTASDGT